MRGVTGIVRRVLVAFAALLLFFSSMASPVALGEVFRIDLPLLERPYQFGQSSAIVPINLGTPLADLASIQLELSGVHTNGWWVGDMVEDHYVGPRAGHLSASMDSASSDSWRWSGGYYGVGDGPFTVTMSLHSATGGSDWSFLTDGVTDLTLTHDFMSGWGQFTTSPFFSLTDVALVINATPSPEPSTFALLGIGSATLLAWGWWRRRGMQNGHQLHLGRVNPASHRLTREDDGSI